MCPRRGGEIRILDIARILSHTVSAILDLDLRDRNLRTPSIPYVDLFSDLRKVSHLLPFAAFLPSSLLTDIFEATAHSSLAYYCLDQHRGQSCPSWLCMAFSALFFNPFCNSLHALHQNSLLLSSTSCPGSVHMSGAFPWSTMPGPALAVCSEPQGPSQTALLLGSLPKAFSQN